MDCTVDNFEEVLERLERELPTASFVSIDGEFTGLHLGDEHLSNEIDTIEERYHKVSVAAQSFDIIQFGICLFHEQQQSQESSGDTNSAVRSSSAGATAEGDDQHKASVSLVARPYNFYLFKRSDRNHIFACHGNGISFLLESGMDFNKVFGKGISYCNAEELQQFEKQQEMLQKAYRARSAANEIDVSELHDKEKAMLQLVMERVGEWIESGDEDTLLLDFMTPLCNMYQRRLLFQQIGKKFGDMVTMKSVIIEGETIIQLSRAVSEEDKLRVEQEREADMQRRVTEFAGFRRVVELLLLCKKPLIGHNFMLDLVYLYEKCVNPLPATAAEFKTALLEAFGPCIVDTKYMASAHEQFHQMFGYNTNLKALLDATDPAEEQFRGSSKMVAVQPAEGFELIAQSALHNAAYDAYITGILFARLSHFIGINSDKDYDGRSVASTHHIKELINKLNLVMNDAYFDLSDPEAPEQDRSDVFLLTDMSQGTVNEDIQKMFEPYGQIKIIWIAPDCCFVRLRDKTKAAVAATEFMSHTDLGVTVMTYDQAQEGTVLQQLRSRYGPVSLRSRNRPRLMAHVPSS